MPKPQDTDEQDEKPTKKEQLVSKSKLDEKEAELESLRKTLRAIEGAQQQPQRPQTPGGNQLTAFAKVIADEMGWDAPEAVSNVTGYLRVVDRYANTVLQEQLYPVLNGLADRVDGIEARVQYPDFTKYESEIDAERKDRAARGTYLSRSEAYHLVRGKHLPDILEEEKAKLAEDRTPPPADDTVRGTQKAGPTGAVTGRLPSRDELASMTPEQRKELASSMTF